MGSDTVKFYDRDIEITLYKQDGSKRWYARFTYEGKQHRFACKTEEIRDAKQYCYTVIDELLGDEPRLDPEQQTVSGHMITFNELFDKFYRHKQQTGKAQQRTLDDYTRRGGNLKKWCGEWVVETEFRKYDKTLYGLYIDWRNTDGRQTHQIFRRKIKSTGEIREYQGRKLPEQLSGTTINDECVLLHSILNYAKYDLNLLRGWDVPAFKHHRLPQRCNVVCPTRDEYIQIAEYFLERGRLDIYWWCRLVANTGLRPAESFKLTIDDVDFRSGVIKILNRKNKAITDNRLDTYFPITSRIDPIIRGLIAHTQDKRREVGDRVSQRKLFLNPKTGKPMGSFKTAWTNMLDNLGLDRRYTPKTLRKVFITKMVKQSSIPLATIAILIGHRNTQTLQKHYLHLRPDDLKRGLEDAYNQIEDRKQRDNLIA